MNDRIAPHLSQHHYARSALYTHYIVRHLYKLLARVQSRCLAQVTGPLFLHTVATPAELGVVNYIKEH
jgi:hypothetical protein